MYKERVVASKTCQKKWDENAKKIHAEKLKHIKPSIDNSSPQTQVHLENRRKRDQIVEDRLTTIEKHNLILLERMMTIMKRPSSLDNNNTRSKSPSKSLNREAKKRELERINAENQIILKKLTSAKAYYDHKDWDKFQKNQETYLKNICEYPVQKSNTQTLPKINSQGPSSREKSLSSPEWRSAPTTTSEKQKSKGRFTKKTIEAHKEWSSAEKKYFSDNDNDNDNDNDSLMLSDLGSDDDLKEDSVDTNQQKKKTVGAKKVGKDKDKAKGKGKRGKDKVKDAKHEDSDGGSSGSESLGSDFSDSFDNESDDDDGNANNKGKDNDKDQKDDALSNSNSLAASEEKNSTILSPGSRHQEEFEKDDEEYKPQDEDDEEKASVKNKEKDDDSDLDGLDGDFDDDLGDKSD